MSEQTITTPEPAQLLRALGGPTEIGPIAITQDTSYRFTEFQAGEYEVDGNSATSTGRLLRVGEYCIKTFLDPNHPFLQFSEDWQRLFCLAAEAEKTIASQADWRQEERIHLGLVGVVKKDGNTVDVVPLRRVTEPEVEPGLLMRFLSENMLDLLLNDPQTFEALLPAGIAAIKVNQQPLSEEVALTLGGRDGVYKWIDGGNLQTLRTHPDQRAREYANFFWYGTGHHPGFLAFVRRYGDFLNYRARTGAVVEGNGDTKIRNMFRVGERIGIIDPITLLVKTDDQGGYELAPWPFRDRISELAYFTIYLLAFQKLADSSGEVQDLERLYGLTLDLYAAQFGEEVRQGTLRALLSFYESALAQVEYELNLRLGSSDQDQERLKLAEAMREISLDRIRKAHKEMRKGEY